MDVVGDIGVQEELLHHWMSAFTDFYAWLLRELGLDVAGLVGDGCEGNEAVQDCKRLNAVAKLLIFGRDFGEEPSEGSVAFCSERFFVLVTLAEQLGYFRCVESGNFPRPGEYFSWGN